MCTGQTAMASLKKQKQLNPASNNISLSSSMKFTGYKFHTVLLLYSGVHIIRPGAVDR